MKYLLWIFIVIMVLAALFFIFNYGKLEVIKLGDGIGSYSAVNVDIYDKDNITNVNVYHSTPVSSTYTGDFDIAIYLNQMTLDISPISERYPNLAQSIKDNNNHDWNFLSDETDLIIRLSKDNYTLPKEIPTNIPMTPQRFFQLYPTGLEVELSNFKMSKIIMGVDTQDEVTINIPNLKCKLYCAPNPTNMSTYIFTCIPYEYNYEYNFFTTLEVVEADLQAIKLSKPNLENINNEVANTDFAMLKQLFNVVVHPIKLLKFYSTSAEILISDFSGMMITNELEAYSPF